VGFDFLVVVNALGDKMMVDGSVGLLDVVAVGPLGGGCRGWWWRYGGGSTWMFGGERLDIQR